MKMQELLTEHVRKVGSQWFVFNHTGKKRLSKGYSSKKQADERLREIEAYKHMNG